ncbi:MAG: translation initiation factor IF-3 [Pseudomonadota bacterium]
MRQDPRSTQGPLVRVNHRIRVSEVRVIGEDGKMLGVMPTKQAQSMASQAGLDLVEINPKAVPPVCKVMDYGKFKYEKKKKEREAKKNQTVIELKEVKFRPNTDSHDIGVKTRNIKRFLEEKNKAKLTVRFRGREMAHKEIGRQLLMRVAESVAELGVITQHPREEGRVMTMIISPKE